jgi:hypothetical protein
MAQGDLNVANQSGAAFRADLNNQLAALGTLQSGASAPSTTYAYMLWADTTTGLLKLRNAANNAWITIGTLADTNLGLMSLAGGTLTGALLADDGGTAALPAVAFDGDSDTGIYRKAANELGVTTGGVLRGWFDSAGVNLTAQGDTRYWDSDSTHYVAFQAPATVASNITWTLPSGDGTAGQSLTTNGSGVLSFSDAVPFATTSEVKGTHTTGTVTSGTTSLTVASATGIVAGMFVVGEGITPGTTVSSIASTTVTLSANAGATLSSDPVSFYSASKVITPATVGGMLCRAWVNFNGTGTVAIRASYNVSSITDNGTGDYTVNFTTAMVDANYSFGALCSSTSGANGYVARIINSGHVTSSSLRVEIVDPGVAAADALFVGLLIFR